jgi:hypothetical protein
MTRLRSNGIEDASVAAVSGINVHAKQLVGGRDRKQLERLCRYVTRPPLSQEHLEQRTDGRLGEGSVAWNSKSH